MTKIAINGFGRIGRTFLRSILLDNQALQKIDVCVINLGPAQLEALDILLEYDSTMGKFPDRITLKENKLVIKDRKIEIIQITDPTRLNWTNFGIDWVVDCSGQFTTLEKASLHLKQGAKRVLISAPADPQTKIIVPGVNLESFDPYKDKIISLGSCTTNCLAPILKVALENTSVEYATATTVHAYTSDQRLLDNYHPDPRRARAAAQNIIPTKTGVDKTIELLMPNLKGKFKAFALRVPVPKVSIVDITLLTKEKLTKQEWNSLFIKAASESMKNILACEQLPLVSSDFAGNPNSSIVDLSMTYSQNNTHKIFSWYDNEYGYSNRLKDFLIYCSNLQKDKL